MGSWIAVLVDAALHDVFNDLRNLLADLLYISFVLFIFFVVSIAILAIVVATLVDGPLTSVLLIIFVAFFAVFLVLLVLTDYVPSIVPMRTEELIFDQWERQHSRHKDTIVSNNQSEEIWS
jgi:hypothetical protein